MKVKKQETTNLTVLFLDLPEGGSLERGGLFIKSNDKDIFGNFSVLLSHILREST